MPDALDLLTICVEAGLGFDAAMQKVAEKWQSELSMAFARVLQEVNLGKSAGMHCGIWQIGLVFPK